QVTKSEGKPSFLPPCFIRNISTFARSDVCNVEAAMSRAELFRAECNRLILETEKASVMLYICRTEQRLKDIQFQKKELELRLEEILSETQDLKALQGRVRKKTGGKEAVAPCGKMDDEVNSELLKEKQTLEEVASLLHTVQEQISEQISRLMFFLLFSSTVSPKQWEDVSELNMTKAEQQKSNCLTLKALVESVLVQTAADTQAQFKATREALQLNIQQVKTVKSQLEEKLEASLAAVEGFCTNRNSRLESCDLQWFSGPCGSMMELKNFSRQKFKLLVMKVSISRPSRQVSTSASME
uniref:Tektin n=1 Tax=Cyprinodon variegatus TaxID=28743 RepID=A0A3Q2E7W3_CYPVA